MLGMNSELLDYKQELERISPPKNNSRVRSYCFTVNNWTEGELAQIAEELRVYSYYVIGKELSSTGTPHLQGFVYEPKKISFNTLKRLMPRAAIFETKARGKKFANAWNYCKKEGDFIEYGQIPMEGQGKRSDLVEFMETVDAGEYDDFVLMKAHPEVTAKFEGWCSKYKNYSIIENELVPPNIELREWQKAVKEMLDGDIIDRRIIWVWSQESLTGKSTFMKWLHATYKRQMMSTDELRKKDVLFAYNNHKIVHIDLTRDMTEDQRKYLKSTIEAMSDNKLQLSGKYASCEKLVKCHVIVTANQPPIDGLPYRYHEFHLLNNMGHYEYTNWQDQFSDADGRNKYYKKYAYKMQVGTGTVEKFMQRIPWNQAQYMTSTPLINNRY